jgi:hypothetical protein
MHVGFSDGVGEDVDFVAATVTALLHQAAADELKAETVSRLAALAPLDIPHRVDLDDYDRFFERFLPWADGFVEQSGTPAAIVGLGEHTTVPAARLRERYGVPGTSLRTATFCRDNVLMKEAVAAAGVRAPRFADLPDSDPLLLEKFASEFQGAIVLKPKSQA